MLVILGLVGAWQKLSTEDANGADVRYMSRIAPCADLHRTAKIVGGVVGGVVGLVLIATLIGAVVYSRSTYYVRAKKRLVQDQVYNLVMGVRQLDPFSDSETQVSPHLSCQDMYMKGLWCIVFQNT